MANKISEAVRNEAWVVFLSSYPPRECGIATFTKHLSEAIDRHTPAWLKTKVYALNESKTKHYRYHKKVIGEIVEGDRGRFAEVARELNADERVRLVVVEHEFGLFGGESGDAVMSFYEALDKLVFTTVHTVMPNPEEHYLKGLTAVIEASAKVVVMNETGAGLLQSVYGVASEKILVIPHGIPPVPLYDPQVAKRQIGFADRKIISTFGLINPDKGIEVVLEALPPVVEQFPEVLFLIVGQTHPSIVARFGEGYRQSLVQQVGQLGLSDNVRFVPQYLPEKELVRYLRATDIYVNSSQNPDQIVSGTLAYAIGAGRAVISTPFLHAKELAEQGLCLLTEFEEPASFTAPLVELLAHSEKRRALEEVAYAGTRHTTWPNVALAYYREFADYLPGEQAGMKNLPALPTVRLGHLLRLTDGFGVIQFSHHSKPDVSSGYCVDDTARAMLALAMHWSVYRKELVFPKLQICLDFIEYVQGEDGRFHNMVDIERTVNTVDWSSDAHARTLWALGYVMDLPGLPKGLRAQAGHLFREAMPALSLLATSRSISFAIAGLYYAYQADSSPVLQEHIVGFADRLVELYEEHAHDTWQWFENELTYSNSKLPEALLYAYAATKNGRYLEVAETTLDFLRGETFYDGIFHPIGQEGWYVKDKPKARFDQQPIDVASMVRTLIVAHRVTKKGVYLDEAAATYHWFLGRNALHRMIYDPETGGCHDGLRESGVNQNQGAESTIVHLMARFSIDTRVKLL